MIEITISFADLTHENANVLAHDNGCEVVYDGTYHVFTSWFDTTMDMELWSRGLIADAHKVSGVMVAAVPDPIQAQPSCWCLHWYGTIDSDHQCS